MSRMPWLLAILIFKLCLDWVFTILAFRLVFYIISIFCQHSQLSHALLVWCITQFQMFHNVLKPIDQPTWISIWGRCPDICNPRSGCHDEAGPSVSHYKVSPLHNESGSNVNSYWLVSLIEPFTVLKPDWHKVLKACMFVSKGRFKKNKTKYWEAPTVRLGGNDLWFNTLWCSESQRDEEREL